MSTCRLCGAAAKVGPVYAPGGQSVLATSQTDCPDCGSWRISLADSPLLDKESEESKRRISAKIRERLIAEPDNPLDISRGLMLFCRHEE
jgi:hypothetical protein